jgi:hypothetical protein
MTAGLQSMRLEGGERGIKKKRLGYGYSLELGYAWTCCYLSSMPLVLKYQHLYKLIRFDTSYSG